MEWAQVAGFNKPKRIVLPAWSLQALEGSRLSIRDIGGRAARETEDRGCGGCRRVAQVDVVWQRRTEIAGVEGNDASAAYVIK